MFHNHNLWCASVQYHLKPPKVAKVARFINTLQRPRRVSFVRLDAAFEEADNAR